ncbi:MAG TPA: DUF72 domain-containing protein [Patescibacteria group bacterium]|nr:DUF72 domain-containing protein [Patescibacteria group bacterium]
MKKPANKPAANAIKPRLTRAAKREMQRQANGGRALEMRKFRKQRERDGLPQVPPSADPVNIGCSGWFYWHWRGQFYPADLPTKDWFAFYRSRMKTVEINASFYSWPTVANVKAWLRQAGERNFIYTVKVCELITHTRKFVNTKVLIRDFGVIADLLGPRFGCFLFQFPASYRYTPARLKSILSQLDPTRRNVVEFRHGSWWNEKVYDAFRKAGAIFCSCSAPKLPDDLICTADDLYIRFHGREKWYRYNYSNKELSDWAQKIRASGAKRVWAYFNNDFGGYAPKNARSLERLLAKQPARRRAATKTFPAILHGDYVPEFRV